MGNVTSISHLLIQEFTIKYAEAAPAASVQLVTGGTPISTGGKNPLPEPRKEFTPKEQDRIRRAKKEPFPKLFPDRDDSPTVTMSNAVLPAMIAGGALAIPGSQIGSSIGGMAGTLLGKDDKPFKAVGAGLGVITTGLLGFLLGYKGWRAHNENVKDTMLRFPEGATIGDLKKDPVYEGDPREISAQIPFASRSGILGGSFGGVL